MNNIGMQSTSSRQIKLWATHSFGFMPELCRQLDQQKQINGPYMFRHFLTNVHNIAMPRWPVYVQQHWLVVRSRSDMLERVTLYLEREPQPITLFAKGLIYFSRISLSQWPYDPYCTFIVCVGIANKYWNDFHCHDITLMSIFKNITAARYVKMELRILRTLCFDLEVCAHELRQITDVLSEYIHRH